MKAQAQSLLEESRESIAEPVRKEMFLEEPHRSLYRTNRRDFLIQELINPGTPGTPENKKGGKSRDQAVLRNEISSYLFEYLKGFHVPTHYQASRPGAEMLVKKADPIPLVVRVINRPDEKWAGRFGLTEGVSLEFPVMEHYLVGKDGARTWINEYHLYAFNIVTPDEFRGINRLASKINAVLRGLSERRGMLLAELSLRFGRYNNQIIATDELSQLTCRFLERSGGSRNGESLYVPVDTGNEEALEAFCRRLKLTA
jgi:phosphoribosylaminoimidazole-succinocarboxamide synthase